MDKDPIPAGEPVQGHREGEAEEIRYPDGRIEHPAVRDEPTDLRFGCILVLIVLVCCLAGIIYSGIWRFFWFQEGVQKEIKQSPYPLAPAPSTAAHPQPRLEQLDRMRPLEQLGRMERMTPAESAAVNEQLANDLKDLHSYSAGKEKGFVCIPIEQAIKAVAGTLPVDKRASPGRDANGLLDAGQSNSGRMFRGPSP